MSWGAIDLAPYLDGSAPGDEPALLDRDDGRCLLYRGKLHSLAGEPECGKSWLALYACVERLSAGERVVYVDFEDGPATLASRLLALGCDPQAVADRFAYVRPDEPLQAGQLAGLLTPAPALVVLDGLTELLAIHGLDLNSNSEVAELLALVPRPCCASGAAVLMLDHVVKRKDDRGRWAIGAQHKLAGVDLAYALNVSEPAGRGREGQMHLVVSKDRPGHVRGFAAHGKQAATMILRSTGERVEIELRAPGAAASAWRPTGIMERVSRTLEADSPRSTRALRAAVSGRNEHVDLAAERLVAEGFACSQTDAGARLYSSVQPFRETDDEDRAPHGPTCAPGAPSPAPRPALRAGRRGALGGTPGARAPRSENGAGLPESDPVADAAQEQALEHALGLAVWEQES